jgi:hypothetical protein
MKRSITIIGSVLLAAALISPAWAKPGKGGGGGGGGEPQAGGLPALEDRVEADEALIATLQGQNNFALVAESATTCTLLASNSSAGPVTATFVSNGVCEVTFNKDVALCSSVATIVGATGGEITVTSTTKTVTGDSVDVATFIPAGTPGFANVNLTVTCP